MREPYARATVTRRPIRRLAEALDGLIAAPYDEAAEDEPSWIQPLAALRSDIYDLLRAQTPLRRSDLEDVCRETQRAFQPDGPHPMFAQRCADLAAAPTSLVSTWLREMLTICEAGSQWLR